MDLHQSLDDVLNESVRIITGGDFGPRPGQKALAHDILDAMLGRGRVAGCAPTGVGKALALLAPAMLVAATCDERSVLSTESLALQAQIMDKDAPDVALATERVTGYRPTFAVHKGFANHVCHLAAHNSAKEVLSQRKKGAEMESPTANTHLPLARQRELASAATAEAHEAISGLSRVGRTKLKVADRRFDPSDYLDLLSWATKDGCSGDRAQFPGDMPYGAWQTVSVTPAECAGAQSCPFASTCLPRAARDRASEADIVVTNHALLGIQAATGAPTVLGNRTLGNISHLLVDEAHGLPGIVRNGGSAEVSAGRMTSVVASVSRVIDVLHDKACQGLIDSGDDIASHLEAVLGQVPGLSEREPVRVDASTPGLVDVMSEVQAWCKAANQMLPDGGHDDLPAWLKLRRARSRVDQLSQDASTLARDNESGPDLDEPDDHGTSAANSGVLARWVEIERGNPTYHSSPVDAAGLIAGNLFKAKLVPDDHVVEEDCRDEEGNPVMVQLGVAMVSATLPPGFRSDSGIGVATKDYPSPFDAAYAASMAHCPRLLTDEELEQVANRGSSGRWRFDTEKHAVWAADRILELVNANGGRALVLSANRKNGERYAEHLRRSTDLRVLSQWDGRDPRLIVSDWRADTDAVMVGTRSLMTGIDAKGETCTLVVIDRVPRASGNVVDDARVEAVMQALETDRWSADAMVYVTDPATLLEQAFGRLVRTMDDSGLAACLDPRIVPGSPLSYARKPSDTYLHAMRRFTNRRTTMAAALEFIAGHRAASDKEEQP